MERFIFNWKEFLARVMETQVIAKNFKSFMGFSVLATKKPPAVPGVKNYL